jgi:flavin prenyltransferase
MARYLVCMTGASGAIYGLRLLSRLASGGPDRELHLVATAWAERVVAHETGAPLSAHLESMGPAPIRVHAPEDLAAPVSSGSFRLDGTIVVPCSMGTIGAAAAGLSANLVQRAAAVALKEGWPLVLVPRESPLSLPSLRALVALKEAGAVVLPASPGFYGRPRAIEELVDRIVFRALEALGIPASDAPAWNGEGEE